MKIKIKTIIKKRNNLIHLASELQKFFTFINEFKYIYLQPNNKFNINNIFDNENFETFDFYLNENYGCLCYNESLVYFL